MSGHLRVEAATIAVVTDLGRVRGPRFGLPVNGALDQYSARAANILVGNDDRAPLVEVTASDFACSADRDLLVSVTGADLNARVDDEPVPTWEPVNLPAGRTLSVTGMRNGIRAYIAFHGGLDAPRLLGSCAPDSVVGFGAVLAPGTRIGCGSDAHAPVHEAWGQSLFDWQLLKPHLGETAEIDVIDGPEAGEFDGSLRSMYQDVYAVTEQSNHVGLRLAGGTIPRRRVRTEQISRGVPIGALEVPAGDELLILHRGRGVTAGYPVLGVVTSPSLDALGQVGPGQRVRLRRVELEQAVRNAREWRDAFVHLRERVTAIFAALGLEPASPAHQSSARPNASQGTEGKRNAV